MSRKRVDYKCGPIPIKHPTYEVWAYAERGGLNVLVEVGNTVATCTIPWRTMLAAHRHRKYRKES